MYLGYIQILDHLGILSFIDSGPWTNPAEKSRVKGLNQKKDSPNRVVSVGPKGIKQCEELAEIR